VPGRAGLPGGGTGNDDDDNDDDLFASIFGVTIRLKTIYSPGALLPT
jgi:hypothetical protein